MDDTCRIHRVCNPSSPDNPAAGMNTANHNANLDEFIAASLARPEAIQPCCTKGCNLCCEEAAYCDANDAEAMISQLQPDQIEALKLRVIEWMQQTTLIRRTEKQMDAFTYREHRIKCPMLCPETGLCLAYAVRPMGCRTFFAIGNKADCQLPNRKHQKFVIFNKQTEALICRDYLVNCLTHDGKIVLDHIGVMLFEKLFNKQAPSASRQEITR